MNIYRLEKLFLICFLFLIIILWYYQIIKGEYFFSLSEKGRIRIIPFLSERGKILDRNAKELATYIPILNIVAIPHILKDKKMVFEELSNILGIPTEELNNKYERNLYFPFMPVVLVKNISLDKVFIIEEKKPELMGIDIEVYPLRFYPFGPVASHLLGYLGEISSEELSELKPYGYRIKNLVGKMGIEKTLDVYLRGENGGLQVEVDNFGNIVRTIGEKKALRGKDIHLTIEADWQKKAHSLLKGLNGAIIIMDVNNGEILTMESSPTFDPNIFLAEEEQKIQSVLTSHRAIFLNRATKVNIPPGSIFKLIVAIAGLTSGKITAYTQYKCEGKFYLGSGEFRCWLENGHGYETVVEAIKHSCNIFFYKLGLELGIERIKNFADLFELGKKTGIEIEEKNGFIPTPKWKQTKFKERWFEGDTANISIGQGYILVTPLQILRLVAAIANGGFLIKPHLVKSIEGIPIQDTTKEYTGINPRILKIIREGMFKVVNEPNGTGSRANVEKLEIAAKTATVQTTRGNSHALITGFLPYSNPKLCFIIFLEHGGSGGVEAAELCHNLFSALKNGIVEYQ
ncbi:MAG: penicillin-binding protein 2 [Candidatus Omnitrophica bacterium]|nr:penicillin-binding protein 2 [Candidatus Omnitrophota bacterium]